MKKILSVFLSLVMLLSVTAGLNLTAFAETSGGYTYSVLDDGTVEIDQYSGSVKKLSIPSTLEGYTVTRIDDFAFESCKKLKSVTIPDSVTSIGDSAFYGCTKLTSVTISGGVISIDDQAFYRCTKLKSITIPNSVTSIGFDEFGFCDNLTDIYYSGTISEWKSISIDKYNEYLNSATIHCTNGDIKATKSASTPKKTSVKELTSPKKKQIRVAWNTKTYVTGYQIQIATNQKFTTNKKTVTIKDRLIYANTIKGLKSNTTYYVRVRTYKTVSGKKVYSAWSSVKSVKTK